MGGSSKTVSLQVNGVVERYLRFALFPYLRIVYKIYFFQLFSLIIFYLSVILAS